jgi:hypothetical protein
VRTLAIAAVTTLALAAPADAADRADHGRVHAKPRTCVPKGADVVARRHGVVFSQSIDYYACKRRLNRSYDLYGPIYAAGFGDGGSGGGCELDTTIKIRSVRRTAVRYRIECLYSSGVGSAQTDWNAIANLRTGWISYRRAG